MLSRLERFNNYCKWIYLQYTLNTAIYTLTPNEIMAFNVIVLLLMFSAAYSTMYFFNKVNL